MSSKKITIKEVSEKAGVSKSLVSKYLNKKFNSMSVETKEKIEQTIKELDYVPSSIHRHYKEVKCKSIGLIIPDITDSFYANVCSGVFSAGFDRGYNVIMGNVSKNVVRENEYIEQFAKSTDGIILASVNNNANYINNLSKQKPIVLLEKNIISNQFDLVTSNNFDAVTELLNYFYALGYESFALFSEMDEEGTSRLVRYNAFMEFIKSKNLEDNAEIYKFNLNDNKKMVKNLIEFNTKYCDSKRVAIALNGRMLIRLLSATSTLELDIPNDMAISGYDDFGETPLYLNGITTIKQPVYEMGYTCAERLIDRIEGKLVSKPEHIEIKSSIIVDN